jgi:DNA-binding response OmpR family regulator
MASLERIPSLELDLAVVNTASLRTSGQRTCQDLRDQQDDLPILLICTEMKMNGSVDANQILALPFTLRKLLNRIRRGHGC